jgi:hypothetical protein
MAVRGGVGERIFGWCNDSRRSWRYSKDGMQMKDRVVLTPLERALLQAADGLRAEGTSEVHADALTKLLEDVDGE